MLGAIIVVFEFAFLFFARAFLTQPMVSAVIPARPPSCIDSTAVLGTITIVEFSFAIGKLLDLVATGQPNLPNDSFDTGEVAGPGKYRLNDENARTITRRARQAEF